MEGVESEFDHAWESVAEQRDAQLREDRAGLEQALQEELEILLGSVQQSLAEDQPEIEKEIEKLSQMAREFREGVEMWQRKAQSGVRMIEEKQRALGSLVQETSIRTAARREDLIQRQKQWAEDAKEKCASMLREVATAARD